MFEHMQLNNIFILCLFNVLLLLLLLLRGLEL